MRQLFSTKYTPGMEEEIIENLKRLFIAVSGIAGQKLQLKMIDEQEIVMNLADVLAEVYVSESMLLRVQKLRNKKFDADKIKIVEQMLQLHMYESLRRIRTALEHAIDSLPEDTKQKLQRKMVKRFARRYEVNPKELRRNIANYFIEQNGYNF
jgi:uncharacterized protein (DUF111 family)